MAHLYLDIETAPTNDKEVIQSIRDSITAPGNYSKPESIQKWMDENLEAETDKLVRKTALDGLYGQIISIAWAIDDKDVKAVFRTSYDDAEADILNAFLTTVANSKDRYGQRQAISTWIGHYISGFDLRFIWQRCVVNKVKPAIRIPYDSKPWGNDIFDTKVEWSGMNGYSGGSSLDKLTKAMGGSGKGEINGANVFDYWKAGEIEKVVEYNMQDVEDCRMLYKRMNFIEP